MHVPAPAPLAVSPSVQVVIVGVTQLCLGCQWILLDTVLYHLLKRVKGLGLRWRISHRLLGAHCQPGWGKFCSSVDNDDLSHHVRMLCCDHGRVPSTHRMPDHDCRSEVQGRDETRDVA